MGDEATQAALNQIFDRLGKIDGRLEAGGLRHDEFSRELKEIKSKIEPLPILKETVEAMKPIVDDYRASRNKLAGIFLSCTMLAGGIGFFASEIKAALLGRH